MQLSNDQLQAMSLIHNGHNVFLTGNAGTGKSYLLNQFKKITLQNIVFVAPTGLAANNIGGLTIHKLFKVPQFICKDAMIDLRASDIDVLRLIDVIVIDEISMVRADVFWYMDQVMRKATGINLPFGGRQIIACGDFFQLPPVASRDETSHVNHHFGGIYAFESQSWKDAGFIHFNLTTVHRQDNIYFLSLLDRLRFTNSDSPDAPELVESINQAVINNIKGAKVSLCATNQSVDMINQQMLNNLNTPVIESSGFQSGEYCEDLPVPETLVLKLGAKVILLQNMPLDRCNQDFGYSFTNGDTGIITDIYFDSGEYAVEVTLEKGKTVLVKSCTWNSFEYTFTTNKFTGQKQLQQHLLGSYTQLPLKPAYAITIHKSQGMTLDGVHIDLGYRLFSTGQLYTAFSRCKSLENITISRPLTINDLKVDPKIVNFYNSCKLYNQPGI